MPAAPFANSQGVTFSFNNVTYTATSISCSLSRGEFDVSSTDLTALGLRRLRAGKIISCELKVDWIGGTVPPTKIPATFTVSGTDIGAAGVSGKSAICTGLTISAVAGDLIKGSATFKVSKD